MEEKRAIHPRDNMVILSTLSIDKIFEIYSSV